MKKTTMKQQLAHIIIWAFVLLFFGWFLISVLGSETRCLIRLTTGIPCPGCGLSRAYTALSHGDIQKAFTMHPLFLFPLYIGIVYVARKTKLGSRLYRSTLIWALLGGLFILTYLLRMYFMFPDYEPMQFYENGIIPRLLSFFKLFQ